MLLLRCPSLLSLIYMFITDWDKLDYEGPVPTNVFWPKKHIPEYIDQEDIHWNLKEQCLYYLKKDVLATKWVFDTLKKYIYECFHVNVEDYLTISHMSWELWAACTIQKMSKGSNMKPVPMTCVLWRDVSLLL